MTKILVRMHMKNLLINNMINPKPIEAVKWSLMEVIAC
jgi:hypothetical protein